MARSIVTQGHQVFFLTRKASEKAAGDSEGQPAEEWTPLDSAAPGLLHLAVPGRSKAHTPGGQSKNHAARKALKRATTALNWMRGRSSDPLWVKNATQVLPRALQGVEIDLVWATFTPIETWTIGHDFAQTRGIPFVGDVKDPWSHYVPQGLRQIVFARYSKLSALTFNSKELCKDLPIKSGRLPQRVIYSGYWRSTVNRGQSPRRTPQELTAAFFGRLPEQPYRQFLVALNCWARSTQVRIAIKYWGKHADLAGSLVKDLPSLTMNPRGYIGTEELIRECAAVDFNFYARAGYQGIHHKATELLAARKPILVWGHETDETIGLAGHTGVPLLCASTTSELAQQMQIVIGTLDEPAPLGDEQKLNALSWEEQGKLLLDFLALSFPRARDGMAPDPA